VSRIVIVLLAGVGLTAAQPVSEMGHSIGAVSTHGNLIVLDLDQDALGRANLFDLAHRTVRFAPAGTGYRVHVENLQWDGNLGPELRGSSIALHRFAFPFSGKRWNTFLLGATGSIRFGVAESDIKPDAYGKMDGGVSLGRFDELAQAASTLSRDAPAICVFLKPRLSGPRYVRESADRVVITWDLTEPFGNILDFTWFRTVNRFQAVLHADGSIDMSYQDVAARDGIVGLYPAVSVSRGDNVAAARVHFSSLTPKDGPFRTVYESFHYLAVPRGQDLSCTVVNALGDKFDFLAYYADFRIDNQEATSPSAPIGGDVAGIGPVAHNPESYCSRGRLQWALGQPVYVNANEMAEWPPAGAPVGGRHDLTFYARALAESTSNARALPYDYAMSSLGHEFAHRWSAYVTARVNGERIPLGSWPHWDRGLQARVAFPYERPVEASTIGGGVWQDNLDGTYTQLHDGYFVPATGYSYLDLYLMGFISPAEVPDFFILTNLESAGTDALGRPVFKAQRKRMTIQDVIAAEGPRVPDVDHSQRAFNTGFVVVVEHGHQPSQELADRTDGIRQQWMYYWDRVTGHRSSMTTDPR